VSAAGRGEHRGGDVDFYPTPAWCVDRLLDDCGADLLGPAVFMLEPTIGDGAIVRACDAWYARTFPHRSPLRWTGVELQRGRLDARTRLAEHVEGVDFRKWTPSDRFDVSIGNVAYNIAESLIRHALRHADVVVQLLHLGFLGSDERVDFYRTVGSRLALRVLPERPSFDGEGTDAIPYAWYIWNHPTITGVKQLETTPKGVRNAQKPGSLQFDPRQIALFAGGTR
jgi:hypothetical protein